MPKNFGIEEYPIIMVIVCETYIQKFSTCQQFHKKPVRPVTYYHPISYVIPFAWWGVYLIGAIPEVEGRKKYVVIAINYFTKWVEVEALAMIFA